jgi:death-on-curing protein
MISAKQVLTIHKIAIEKFGGSDGMRDFGNLESALARPFQTFDGKELYATMEEKAAAIGESIIINHPFLDGNKRTGYILMEAVLRYGYKKIVASDDDAYQFVIGISTGEIKFDEIVTWLKNNSQAL